MESIFETVKNAALVHKEGGGTGFDFSRLRPKGSFVQQDPGRRLGPRLVPQGHRRRDRGRQAGRHAPRGQHGHPPGRPSRHRGIHPDEEGRQERRQLQHLGRRHRRLHGGRPEGDVLRHLRPVPEEGRRPEGRPQGLPDDRRVGLGHRRPRPHLHRPHQRRQSDPRPRPHRGDQSLRRAAAPRLRVLQPRLDQPGQLLRPGQAKDRFDWDRFGAVIRLGVRFLDDVIDVNRYPLPEIEKTTRATAASASGSWAGPTCSCS